MLQHRIADKTMREITDLVIVLEQRLQYIIRNFSNRIELARMHNMDILFKGKGFIPVTEPFLYTICMIDTCRCKIDDKEKIFIPAIIFHLLQILFVLTFR